MAADADQPDPTVIPSLDRYVQALQVLDERVSLILLCHVAFEAELDLYIADNVARPEYIKGSFKFEHKLALWAATIKQPGVLVERAVKTFRMFNALRNAAAHPKGSMTIDGVLDKLKADLYYDDMSDVMGDDIMGITALLLGILDTYAGAPLAVQEVIKQPRASPRS